MDIAGTTGSKKRKLASGKKAEKLQFSWSFHGIPLRSDVICTKDQCGNVYNVRMYLCDYPWFLKVAVGQSMGVSPCQLRLFENGCLLNDQKTLASQSIDHDSTVEVILEMTGC